MDEPPYRAIADSTYDWECWIDEDDRLRWVNPAVERLTGLSPARLLEEATFPLYAVHGDDRRRIEQVLRSGREGGAGNDVGFRILHADGSARWAAISWQPLDVGDGRARGFRTSVRDVDARTTAEERVRDAERRASRAAAERSELLATLSHELRSPLHCIAGFAELLGRVSLPPEERRWVEIVGEQSATLLRLVEDLLHFMAMADAPPVLRRIPFDPVRLLEHELDAMRPRARRGVGLRLERSEDPAPTLLGDPDRIRQIVANLLANAVRFTEVGSVTVSFAIEPAGMSICVRDTGAGMEEAVLARVREPFVQARKSSTSGGGVGLGLAIVDRLASAMGGSLALESEVGRGTQATLTLPIALAEPGDVGKGPSTVAPASEESFSELRVLLADDSEPSRELLSAMFRTLGIAVDVAADGRAALVAARRTHYDLVLLDYHMPRLDGVETAKLLRAEAKDRDKRQVLALLTANVLADAFRDPELFGLDVALPKPLRLSQIRALASLARSGGVSSVELSARVARGDVESIDLDVVRDLTGVRSENGSTLLARTLPRVSTEVRRVVAELRRSPEEALGNEELLRAVHSTKGLVASIGARSAELAAARVEAVLRGEAARDELEARIDAFERAYHAAHAKLAELG